MPTILLHTHILAPPALVFDLARDVDLHLLSAAATQERAIAGRTSGRCERGDVITWEAVHLGFRQRLMVEITEMNPPFFFEDQQRKGIFKTMRHRHSFEATAEGTCMIDEFYYVAPWGALPIFYF